MPLLPLRVLRMCLPWAVFGTWSPLLPFILLPCADVITIAIQPPYRHDQWAGTCPNCMLLHITVRVAFVVYTSRLSLEQKLCVLLAIMAAHTRSQPALTAAELSTALTTRRVVP